MNLRDAALRAPALLLTTLLALVALAASVTAEGQPVRERVQVDVIRIPIWARVGSSVIRDLVKEDLILTVDGKVVPIDTLQRDEPPPPPSGAPGVDHAAEEPRRGTSTLIFIDESTTNILDRRDALDELSAFVRAGPPRGRRFMISSLRRGRLEIECPWTDEREVVVGTLRRLRLHPTIAYDPSAVVTSRTGLAELQTFRQRLLAAILQAFASFPDDGSNRQFLFVTGGKTFARPLAPPSLSDEGQRAPEGFQGSRAAVNPAEASRDNFQLWTQAAGPAGALNDFEIAAKAIERDIAIVPIDTAAGTSGAVAEKKRMIDSTARPVLSSELEAAQALTILGEDTGGDFVSGARKAAAKLASLDERERLAITFRDPFQGDHRFHRVAISSRRPGITLGFRRGYRVASDEDRILDRVLANFLEPSRDEGALDLKAAATEAVTDDRRRLTRLALRYSPPRSARDSGDRAADIVVLGRNREGAWTAPVRWSGTATQSLDGRSLEVVLNLGIPPGSFVWSVALRDAPTGLVSYAVVTPAR